MARPGVRTIVFAVAVVVALVVLVSPVRPVRLGSLSCGSAAAVLVGQGALTNSGGDGDRGTRCAERALLRGAGSVAFLGLLGGLLIATAPQRRRVSTLQFPPTPE